ncbi:MAG: aminotransferase class I/II-fold pyridoxal phosphate-dependent enzyme [Acidimicrobiia bacterium]
MPEYISEHFARAAAADGEHPDGYVGLCVAENKLMWDVLEPQLNRNRHVQPASVAYGSMIGSVTLREQIAAFASEHVWGRTVDADHVIALAGAGTILEALFYVISDPGDGVLVPTPSYAGFWPDLETRDDLAIVPVHTSSEDDFRLTPKLLEEAYRGADIVSAADESGQPDRSDHAERRPRRRRRVGSVTWSSHRRERDLRPVGARRRAVHAG